jgi:uncharacterized protein YceK
MKILLPLLTVLVLAGCTSPTKEIDIKNSPCACEYNGEQLSAPKTEREWFEYYSETEAWS